MEWKKKHERKKTETRNDYGAASSDWVYVPNCKRQLNSQKRS